MPAQTGKSSVLNKLAGKINPAAKEHAHDEIDYGFQRVPPGITNGIARLVECKFDTYKTGQNAGEPYFRASGVVVEPATVMVNGNDMPVVGLQTSIMIAIHDKLKDGKGNPIPIGEQVRKVQNEMKKLGADPSSLTDANGLERTAANLKEVGPYFRFRTSVRPARPRPDGSPGEAGVWENWDGTEGLENYSPPEGANGVDDSTGDASAPSDADAGGSGGFDEFGDLDSLVEAAGNNDNSAIASLTEKAIAVGKTAEEVDAADSWQEVADWIKEGGEGGGDTEAAEPDEQPEPAKGEVWHYKPPKHKGKPIEVNIDAVNKKNRTADVHDLTKPANKWKGVSWDALTP